MEPMALTKEGHQDLTIEAVEMDNQEEVLLEVAVEVQNIITAVVSTGVEDVEVLEMVKANLIGAEVDITTNMREKKTKSMKMESQHKIGEIPDQGVLEETSEEKPVEILEVREGSVEPEAVGENVVEEDREVLIVEGPMIEMMMASITTTINIHSQLTKKAMKRSNKPMSKSSGSPPKYLNTLINSKD